jgi:hypothetical protein
MVLEPERLRVLRLRRCHGDYAKQIPYFAKSPADTLSHWSDQRGGIYLKLLALTNWCLLKAEAGLFIAYAGCRMDVSQHHLVAPVVFGLVKRPVCSVA